MDDTEVLLPYRLALARLVAGQPINVEKGTLVSLNAVAKEAGRTAGAIKGERDIYKSLREEIDKEIKKQTEALAQNPQKILQEKLDSRTTELKVAKKLLAESMGRELSLVRQVAGLKKTLHSLTGANILPIRERRSPKSTGSNEE